MNRFTWPLRAGLLGWLRTNSRGWVQPLCLAFVLFGVVCLQALPAGADQGKDEPGGQSAPLFCILFESVCLPVKGHVLDGQKPALDGLTGDWLQELPEDGEEVWIVPDSADASPEVRSALLDWLRKHGVKLPDWLP